MNASYAPILILVGLSLMVSRATAKPDFMPEYSILFASDGPDSVVQSNQFECDGKGYEFVVEKNQKSSTRLVRFTIDSAPVSKVVSNEIGQFFTEFSDVHSINFSCGAIYDGPNPHNKSSKDFRGQLAVTLAGVSSREPQQAMSDCYDRGGIYLDEVTGSITVSAREVIRTRKPDIGICVFGTTSVEIPRADAQKDSEL